MNQTSDAVHEENDLFVEDRHGKKSHSPSMQSVFVALYVILHNNI
jgi:hypothetical protein